MQKDKKSNGGIILVIFLVLLLLGSCGGDDEPSSYEKNLDSGWKKWSSGDYGSMNRDEREAVNNFLEWSNDN